jgi:ribosome biogenesis protein BMS1
LTMDDLTQDHHSHKNKKSGRGAKEKKKDKRAKKDGSRVERHNHRAFSVANIGRTQRTIQRNLDRGQKKEYVPLKDRRAQEASSAPPSLVCVMGPPGVGKVRRDMWNERSQFLFHSSVRLIFSLFIM